MKEKSERVAAAIEIGSSAVRMHVAQMSKDRLAIIDKLEKPINVGHEVFKNGKVGYAALRSLSDVLRGFCSIAREYGAGRIKAVATTALREAADLDHVLDHLNLQNNLNVEVLEPAEVNAYIFNEMLRGLPRGLGDRLLMTYVGTGTLAVAYLEDLNIKYSQIHNIGLLKVSELVRSSSGRVRRVDRLVADYLYSFDYPVTMQAGPLEIDDYVIAGGDMDLFGKMCPMKVTGDCAKIKRDDIVKLYDAYSGLSPEHICARFGLSFPDAELLHSMIMMFYSCVSSTSMNKLYYVRADLLNSILTLHLSVPARRRFEEGMQLGMRSSVLSMARRYNCHILHAVQVTNLALAMYDKLRRLHGLTKRQAFMLEAACLLHETGYIADSKNSHQASFDLVRNSYIYGFSTRDMLMIAHMLLDPETSDEYIAQPGAFALDERLFITKMRALLQVANALDHSRLQKATVEKIEIKRSHMHIFLKVQGDFSLEEWMFAEASALFEESFGMEPVLEIDYTESLS